MNLTILAYICTRRPTSSFWKIPAENVRHVNWTWIFGIYLTYTPCVRFCWAYVQNLSFPLTWVSQSHLAQNYGGIIETGKFDIFGVPNLQKQCVIYCWYDSSKVFYSSRKNNKQHNCVYVVHMTDKFCVTKTLFVVLKLESWNIQRNVEKCIWVIVTNLVENMFQISYHSDVIERVQQAVVKMTT